MLLNELLSLEITLYEVEKISEELIFTDRQTFSSQVTSTPTFPVKPSNVNRHPTRDFPFFG